MVLGSSAAVGQESPAISAEQEQFFESKVRPLLMQHCSSCHGAEKQESELRVDSLPSLLRGGASGDPAIVPGKPEASVMIAAIDGSGDYEMPPDGPLPAEAIDVLRHWVTQGAPWPNADQAPQVLTAAERIESQREQHWALQPLRDEPLPITSDDWSRTRMDRWVWQGLQSVDLEPSQPATRHQLLRRTKLGLLGLPLTYQESQAFQADERPDAFARRVDKYLASPAYGERWGRHWLDVARYADTRGYAFNRDRRYPYAYTYRNYVIDAWNADKPYDRFVIEQLAADQLDLPEDEKSKLAALGFLTVGRKFNNPHDDIDDKIDVVTRGLLGITVACARCHDHKYDAIPTEDYYSLYGVFASCDEPEELPLIADADAIARNQAWFEELEKRKQESVTYIDERFAEMNEHVRNKVYDYLIAAVYNLPDDKGQPHPEIELPLDQIKVQLRDRWKAWMEQQAQGDAGLAPVWSAVLQRADDETLTATLEQQRAAWLASEQAASLGTLSRDLQQAEIGSAQDWLRFVATHFEEAMRQVEAQATAATDASPETALDPARLAEFQTLANLVIGESGLGRFDRNQTGQFLNRADREHLARLDSKVTEHQAGAPAELGRAMVVADRPQPVDPVVFVRGNPARRGDPVPRQFVGLLAGSQREPFQQGSGRLELAQQIVDPENPLAARVLVNRIWMHHFRDPLVSTPSDFGIRCDEPLQRPLLDELAGMLINDDWSIKRLQREILMSAVYQQQSKPRPEVAQIDPENRRLHRQNPRRLGFEATRDSLLAVSDQLQLAWGGKPVDIFNQVDSPSRTVYAYIDRQDLPNLLRSFDFASPDQHAPQRPRTVVPQQALYLMNSPFIRHRASELVERLQLADQTPEQGITMLFEQVLARDPLPEERQALEQLLAEETERPWQLVAQVLLETNELVFVD